MRNEALVRQLRDDISRMGAPRADAGVLPFGVSSLDSTLPGGGLSIASLHEIAGGASGAIHGAAAILFAAGIAARTTGQVLWCITRPDLFAPALAQAGLDPDRLIIVEAGDEASLLACCEESLRHGGLGSVVGEIAKLPMTASRRLKLAAETSGTLAIVIRRWKRDRDTFDFGQPTAATTRWRVTALPSSPLPVPGVGRPRWLVELLRSQAGQSADFVVEACDEKGRLALPAELADRSSLPGARDRTTAPRRAAS
ncbi:MAG: damage-inducible protein [Burkholderiales bacterium]|nr:MAG: damage-inducible protein [Burkholderiales bacterium]